MLESRGPELAPGRRGDPSCLHIPQLSFIEEQPAPQSSPKPHEAKQDSKKLLAQGSHLLMIAAARIQILATNGHCPHPPPQSPRSRPLRVTP